MRFGGVGGLVVGALLLAACAGGGLKDDDPRGYEACSDLEGFTVDGSVDLTENVALGVSASAATTKGIRETAKATFSDDNMAVMRAANPKVEQIYFVNKDALRTACAAAGFKFKS